MLDIIINNELVNSGSAERNEGYATTKNVLTPKVCTEKNSIIDPGTHTIGDSPKNING